MKITCAALEAALVLALVAAPLAVEAQQAVTSQRVGLLWPGGDPPPGHRMEWFRRGLREAGYVEGQNLSIDIRHAEKADRLHELANDLVRSNVDVIVSFGDLGPQMAQKATKTIPIVALTDDFVGAGLVASLGRPKANTTGVNILSPELSAKRLSLLKEMLPRLSRVAVLWDPVNATQLKSTQNAAAALGVKIQVLEVRGREDVLKGFNAATKARAEALNVFASPLLSSFQKSILELAASHRLPAIYQWREHAEEGGLVSYGPSLAEMWRQTALVTGRILKGAKPTDIPIEQPTKFELVINLKTARTLGLKIPPSLLLRADQIIACPEKAGASNGC
jgi:putative tryptophan/tyrosine transport system substrate-binding protein